MSIQTSAHINPLAGDMQAAVSAFITFCKAKNLSENSIVYYRNRLKAFTDYCDEQGMPVTPEGIEPQLVRDFLINETQTKSASTAKHSFVTLRAFFNFLADDGFISGNPMDMVDKPKGRKHLIDTFTIEQIEAMLATCGKDFTGIRDRAIIITFVDCGLRVSELCGLTVDDVLWADQTLHVIGKGDVERVVPFGNTTRQALTQYMIRRGGLSTSALFVNCYGEPIPRYPIARMIQARCNKAGVSGIRCSPHTLRHTMAVMYLRSGGDVFSLQKLLGHRDLSMTRRYCELSETDVTSKHRVHSPADKLSVKQTSGRKRLR